MFVEYVVYLPAATEFGVNNWGQSKIKLFNIIITSHDWYHFLKFHGLEACMSRRGNCHDNAVAESFFQLLKRERIKRKIYKNRDEARQDIFDYIEMFYNPKRRHSWNNQLSPVEYEKQYEMRLKSI